MAIEIIRKTSSNAQELMNLLADSYAWKNVVYDTETTTNVTQLWASDKIYLELSSEKIYTKSTDGFTNAPNNSITYSSYRIYKTDLGVGVMLIYNSNPFYIFVGKTKKPDGTESTGIVAYSTITSGTYIAFTDNMTSVATIAASNFVTDSVSNTQLVRIYSKSSDEYFPDLFWCYMRTNTTDEKLSLEGQNYIATKYLAIRYTE